MVYRTVKIMTISHLCFSVVFMLALPNMISVISCHYKEKSIAIMCARQSKTHTFCFYFVTFVSLQHDPGSLPLMMQLPALFCFGQGLSLPPPPPPCNSSPVRYLAATLFSVVPFLLSVATPT